MIRVQDNPERIESTEEKTGPRLEGDKTGQAQEAFHFPLFFFSFSSQPFSSLPSTKRERERESSGVIQPEALEPRRLNNAPSPGPSFRRDNFAQIEHPCTSSLHDLGTIGKLASTWGTCFSLTHAHICLFATGATCFWISVHLHKGRRG